MKKYTDDNHQKLHEAVQVAFINSSTKNDKKANLALYKALQNERDYFMQRQGNH